MPMNFFLNATDAVLFVPEILQLFFGSYTNGVLSLLFSSMKNKLKQTTAKSQIRFDWQNSEVDTTQNVIRCGEEIQRVRTTRRPSRTHDISEGVRVLHRTFETSVQIMLACTFADLWFALVRFIFVNKLHTNCSQVCSPVESWKGKATRLCLELSTIDTGTVRCKNDAINLGICILETCIWHLLNCPRASVCGEMAGDM